MDEEELRIVDGAQLEDWVSEAIRENPAEVERYRGGEQRLLAFFIGQVMRKSGGRADPRRTRQALLERLAGA